MWNCRTRQAKLQQKKPVEFIELFARWLPESTRFCNRMSIYQDGIEGGGRRTVRVLTITRDAAFLTLKVCAEISVARRAAAGVHSGGESCSVVTREF